MYEMNFKAKGILFVEAVRSAHRHLAPIRVPIFVVLTGIGLTIGFDQIHELYSISVAGIERHDGVIPFLLTACFATLLGVACWRSARILLKYDIVARPEASPTHAHPAFRRWAPRCLGVSVPLAVAIAYATCEPWKYAVPCAAFIALLSGGLLLALNYRRRIFNLPEFDEKLSLTTWKSTVPWLEWLLAIAAFVVVNAIAILQPEWIATIAPIVGPLGCILFLASLLVGMATPLVFFGTLRRAPIFTMLFVWACVIQSCGLVDNHRISVIDAPPPTARATEDVVSKMNQWLDRNSISETQTSTACPYAFFISSEGGGIRAAAWTALVLARMERQFGDAHFADCIVSASGVSGGSLGLAAFVAGRRVLDFTLASDDAGESLDKRLQLMLEADFMSPLITVAFTTDQLQRIVPGVRLPDRGAALESAFTRAFEKSFSTGKNLLRDSDEKIANPFREAFTSLYDIPARPDAPWKWTPILLLNTTDVRSGDRVIQSGLALPSNMDKDFPAARDGSCALGNQISLVGAVHNSARFAYVSPAGNPACRPEIQVVDGGYFENSGTTTSYDMLRLYRSLASGKYPEAPKPVVIHISNDVSLANFDGHRNDDKRCRKPEEVRHPYGEILPPPVALYQTRASRGQYARLVLLHTMKELMLQDERKYGCSMTDDKSCFFFFPLDYFDHCKSFPLGWQIGRSSMCEMLKQRDGKGPNADTFKKFGALFGDSAPSFNPQICEARTTHAQF